MNNFNEYQYQDFLIRGSDLYANTKYKIILEYLKKSGAHKILNVGCGSGELSYMLADSGYDVVGVDPSPEYIDLARKNLPANLRSKCSFSVASIAGMGGGDLFDCIIAADVLEHIEDDAGALQKLSDLLRTGGKLIITVPANPWLFGYHDEQLGHFRRYTKKGLAQLTASIKTIMIDRVRYFGATLIPICFLYSKILRKPYPIAALSDKKKYFKEIILRLLLLVDKFIPLPFGTSLILFCIKE